MKTLSSPAGVDLAASRESPKPTRIIGVGGLTVVCSLYLILGVAYALRTPLWQNPDEPSHYSYVHSLATSDRIPVVTVENRELYEAFQPPLYYLVLTPTYKIFKETSLRDRVIALRMTSVILGLPAIVLAFLVGLLLTPRRFESQRIWVALGVSSLVGLTPQYIAINASINNDVLATTLASMSLLVVLWRIGKAEVGFGSDVLLGTVVAASLMTKLTTLASPIAAGVGLLFWAKKSQTSWKRLVGSFLTVGMIVVALAFPWMVRNLSVYGEPVGFTRHQEINAAVSLPKWDDMPEPTWWSFISTTFASFWLTLGWMEIRSSEAVYWMAAILVGLGILGFMALVVEEIRSGIFQRDNVLPAFIIVLSVAIVTGIFHAWFSLTQFYQAQGRYLFPAIIPIGTMLALGFRRSIPERLYPAWTMAVAVALLALNLNAIFHLVPKLAPLT